MKSRNVGKMYAYRSSSCENRWSACHARIQINFARDTYQRFSTDVQPMERKILIIFAFHSLVTFEHNPNLLKRPVDRMPRWRNRKSGAFIRRMKYVKSCARWSTGGISNRRVNNWRSPTSPSFVPLGHPSSRLLSKYLISNGHCCTIILNLPSFPWVKCSWTSSPYILIVSYH